MERKQYPDQLQDVASRKQNHDEQIHTEREDLHCETRPEFRFSDLDENEKQQYIDGEHFK